MTENLLLLNWLQVLSYYGFKHWKFLKLNIFSNIITKVFDFLQEHFFIVSEIFADSSYCYHSFYYILIMLHEKSWINSLLPNPLKN